MAAKCVNKKDKTIFHFKFHRHIYLHKSQSYLTNGIIIFDETAVSKTETILSEDG